VLRSWSFSRSYSRSFLPAGNEAVFGLADGTLRLAEIAFETKIFQPDGLSPEQRDRLEGIAEGGVVDFEDGVLQRIPGGQVRGQRLAIALGERLQVGTGPAVAVSRGAYSERPRVAASVLPPDPSLVQPASPQTASPQPASPAAPAATVPRLVVVSGEENINFLTGETTIEFGDAEVLPAEILARAPLGHGDPSWLGLSGTGTDLYATWADGSALRIALADPSSAFVAERGRLVPEGRSLTALGFVLGRNTLVWGDDRGALAGGFQVRISDYEGDGSAGMSPTPEATSLLVRTKELATADNATGNTRGNAVRAVAASARTRLVLAAFEDSSLRLYNVTNASELARVFLPTTEPIERIALGPRENIVAATTASHLIVGTMDPRYSEASFNALFRPAWYEGYAKPIHSWQSSSGTDDFEPKHSLMPLIFGTLKATFYSMLFGAPLALLAALFTSELLSPRARGLIKPTIELMASLPSVVLGFLAALVFAPFVERIVATTLASFLALPLAFLLAAYGWQMLPTRVAVRLEPWRFGLMILALPPGILLAMIIGPTFERWLFAGDIKGWLSWDPVLGADRMQFASATGGWMFLTIPIAAAVVWWLTSRVANQRLRAAAADWSRARLACADFAKFLIGLLVTFFLALAAAALLDTFGLDPRGSYLDTYVQRNALIVGFVMGFAIIPIIYTVAEDALSAVPEHLRSASLGAGASRWQTAVRIILPTAASGLFSALMIGLGRAIGETMIVLMAAGNTPVMEWNIFEGFRTLSANIAVELPEAVVGSTHYRTLFLAALVLFVLTFTVNTVAEVIRLRFRKRAYQL
jgi:phosphate transport system permease protein